MSPFFVYLCTITILVSLMAGGVAVANLLHFLQTEKKLRELNERRK